MFKQLNRWLIAWPLVALLFVAGCGEEKYTGPESFGPGEVNPAMNEAFAKASFMAGLTSPGPKDSGPVYFSSPQPATNNKATKGQAISHRLSCLNIKNSL